MAESKAEKAKRARDTVAEALAEFGPFAQKFGRLPEQIEELALSLLDGAEEHAARVRQEESKGRREAEQFISTIAEFWNDDAAELEAERGKRAAAELKAQESEKTLANLQALIPGVTLTSQAPDAAQTATAPQARVNVKPPAGYDIQIHRGADDFMRGLTLTPKGDSGAMGYTVAVHRDGAGMMRSLTLTPETVH